MLCMYSFASYSLSLSMASTRTQRSSKPQAQTLESPAVGLLCGGLGRLRRARRCGLLLFGTALSLCVLSLGASGLHACRGPRLAQVGLGLLAPARAPARSQRHEASPGSGAHGACACMHATRMRQHGVL